MDGTSDRESTPFGSFLRDVRQDLAGSSAPQVPSEPPRKAEWRRLEKGTPPQPGESLRGLVARACQRNTIPNSWGVLQFLGLAHRNRVLVSEDPRVDPAELAYALGVAEDEVASRRYESVAAGRVSFYGVAINADRIDSRVRRFSPTVLGDAELRFHRAVWELKDLPFCLLGWDMLQDRCYCEGEGVIQGWTRTLNRIEECDRCGDPLHWLEPIPVPLEMRPALSLLGALVDPQPEERASSGARLPQELHGADRTQLYRTIILLARAVDPEAEHQPMEEPAQRLNGLHQACEAIRRWPAGWEDLQWHATTKESAIATLRKHWRTLAGADRGVGKGRGGRRLNRPADDVATEKEEAKAVDLIGIRPAYELARLSQKVMLAAWENRLVTQHRRTHGPRQVPAFDVAEVEAFASAWHHRIGPDALSHRLDLPYYGLEQIAAIGTLEADAPALPGTGPHFTPRTVSEFLRRIEDNASAKLSDTLPLRTVMASIGGRLKPWGPVLDLLHGAEIRFRLLDGASLIDRVGVQGDAVERIRALTFDRARHPTFSFRDRMVKRDALEVLNVGVGGDRLLIGLSSQGTNPCTFAVADVEGRAASIMGVPELAVRLGIDWSAAYHRAKRSGAVEIIPGGWDRERLSQLR